MDSELNYINYLDTLHTSESVGRKSLSLARVKQAGFTIPDSVCINASAYRKFILTNRLRGLIEVELGRKPMGDMRWEELWDCGLRIRNKIINSIIPVDIIDELKASIPSSWLKQGVAVRSSSAQEDMKSASFAGLYDSYINCEDFTSVLDSVLKVWSSLWSDRSLLYRHEIGLDVVSSSMAVLVQRMVIGEYSGVAFSHDPNNIESEYLVIEVVPGLCAGLVDGSVEPNTYKLDRSDLTIIVDNQLKLPLTLPIDFVSDIIKKIAKNILQLESAFDFPLDVEWTFCDGLMTILQVRPISYTVDQNDKRCWYLSLSPHFQELKNLANEVNNSLIPALAEEGAKMEAVDISILNEQCLASTIGERAAILAKWRNIYKEKFIPFAHGVREFGQYYNDIVRPLDPYEFIGLLKSEARIASHRLRSLQDCYKILLKSTQVTQFLQAWVSESKTQLSTNDENIIKMMPNGSLFLEVYLSLKKKYFDVVLHGARWADRDDLILTLLLNFDKANVPEQNLSEREKLFEKYIAAADNSAYAKSLLEIGRLSWVLRDDDNLLLSKIESQLLKVLQVAKQSLVEAGQLDNTVVVTEAEVPVIIQALLNSQYLPVILSHQMRKNASDGRLQLKPRQLKGQPAVPGTVSGYACRIDSLEDIKHFKPGNIIICDAVDPNMTHLVPLARGIVERRGGMLIHGVIIARELGIPCVNGVGRLLEMVSNGDYITLDGTLGLIIVGDVNFSNGKTNKGRGGSAT